MKLDYKILFIIQTHSCMHYADNCRINLDSWNIFEQYNWDNLACFICFHGENKLPRHQDSKAKKPRHRDSKT